LTIFNVLFKVKGQGFKGVLALNNNIKQYYGYNGSKHANATVNAYF
jgi:hypothetical protein